MNMQAYKADTAWNGAIPLLFDLLYQEVINGKILWVLNEKLLAYEEATAWNREVPCNIFQNTDPIVFVLFISLFLTRIQGIPLLPAYSFNFKRSHLW